MGLVAVALVLPGAAIAADSTRSMPVNREGGGSRDACQARRLVHLVPIDSRFEPGDPPWIAVLEGSAPLPAPLQVRIGSLGEWTLNPEPAGIRLLRLPPFTSQQVWESSPLCGSPQDPIGAPPARSWLLPRGAGSPAELAANQAARAELQELSRRCGQPVDTASLLRAFALEHLATTLPAQLSVRCDALGPRSSVLPATGSSSSSSSQTSTAVERPLSGSVPQRFQGP